MSFHSGAFIFNFCIKCPSQLPPAVSTPAGEGRWSTFSSLLASKWRHSAIFTWHWQAMITVNGRAEECTVELRVTFANPSMVKPYNELTSTETNFGTRGLHIYANPCFHVKAGRRRHKSDKSVHRLGLNTKSLACCNQLLHEINKSGD